MILDVSVVTKINGVLKDEAESGLNNVIFDKEEFTQRFQTTDADPITRFNHDNISLQPLASTSFTPGYIVEYVYIFLRRVAKIKITQDQEDEPVTVDIHTRLLEMRGTFLSFEIVAVDTINPTYGKILMIGRDILQV